MKIDLVERYCRGAGGRFGGERCPDLFVLTGECRLLKDYELRESFEKGRCQPEDMLRKIISWKLHKYNRQFNGKVFEALSVSPGNVRKAIANYIDSLTFEAATRMKSKRLRSGSTLPILREYIKITAYRIVIDALKEAQILSEKRCRDCRHLSPSTPYFCRRETRTAKGGKEKNPLYKKPRRLSDRAECHGGYEPIEMVPLEKSRQRFQQATDTLQKVFIEKFLHDRAAKAPAGKKNSYERQYVLFVKFRQLVEQNALPSSWKQDFAKLFGVSVRAIERDLKQISEYLGEHGVV